MSQVTQDEVARIKTELGLSYEVAHRASSESFRGFLESVVIDSRPRPKMFWPGSDDWQKELADTITPSIQYVGGLGPMPDVTRFFWVLPRGHDKTTSIGRALNWVLAYGRKSIRASVAAADKDQANLITESMRIEANLNPWLKNRLNFAHGKVHGQRNSRLEVHSSDVAGTWGLNEDLYVLDEITWWKNDKLWIPLLSAFAKRKGVVVLIISNAGEIGSWQENVWKEASSDPTNWKTWSAPTFRCLASWVPVQQREADRRMFPPAMSRRVFDNVWIDPAEVGGYLTMDEAKACEDSTLPLFHSRPRPGLRYYAGIDYGPKKDRTVLTIVHEDEAEGRIVVDRMDVWQGKPTAPVPIADVERWIEEVANEYHADIVCDPYQLESTVQKFEMYRTIERFEARGGKSNYELAECLRSLVINKQLAWHPDCGRLQLSDGSSESFADELHHVVTKKTMYGYRIENPAGRHDDRAVAVGMAALHLLRDPAKGSWVPPTKLRGSPGSSLQSQMPAYKLSIPKKVYGLYGIK
jgi:hypothetical protein